jgi:hypothetical protein
MLVLAMLAALVTLARRQPGARTLRDGDGAAAVHGEKA